MECPRCQGLMVGEVFNGMSGDPRVRGAAGWRCLICGEIVDPVIAANRSAPNAPKQSAANPRLWPRRWRRY